MAETATEKRLLRCFAAAFADLTPQQLRQASVDSVPAWDSVASVTLVATIEEEFGIEVDVNDMANLVSFDRVLAYLQTQITT